MAPPPTGGDGVARPVLLDSATKTFLLRPSPDGSAWTVPRVPLRPRETCQRAVLRYLQRYPGLPPVRISPLVGHHRVGPAPGTREYVVLLRAENDSWGPTAPLGPRARWWSLDELAHRRTAVEPASLPLFMDGYWGGWLPDGEISLD